MGKKTGPKTNWKMTDDTIQKLEQAFAIGADITKACAYADISTQTFYNWKADNPELFDRFERLQNQPVLKALQEVVNGLEGNPELALKYLERVWKDKFSTRTEQDVNITDSEFINLMQKLHGLTDDTKGEGTDNEPVSG